MLSTALPQALPTPVVAPATSTAPTPATGSGQGPESFSRMLDAAEARRQAPLPPSKSAEAKTSHANASKFKHDAAPGVETNMADPDLAPAGGEAVEGAVAATIADAAADPPPATDPALGTDAAALLAGLAALPRPPIADAPRSAEAARSASAGRQGADAALQADGTDATPRRGANTLEHAGITRARMGGAATAGDVADSGRQAHESFAPLMQQARADFRATDPTAATGAQRLQTMESRAAEAVSADTESLASGAAELATQPRSPIADVARSASTGPQVAGAAPEATEAAGTDATTRRVSSTLEPASIAPRHMGGTATAGGGAESGHQAQAPFAPLMQQTRTDSRATDHTAATGGQRLQTVGPRAADARSADTEGLASGTTGFAKGVMPSAMPDVIPSVTSDATFVVAPGVMPKVMPGTEANVVPARLAASPGSPEFAGQLSAQLTTYAIEGVRHARLELHPLELGPVTVQIAVDGAQARVNLSAEHAATRQALEQAMPALASSLREAGLTLSGGGVFDQPRQPQPDGGAATAGGRDGSNGRRERDLGHGTTAESGPAPVPAGQLRRRGVVDLVA